ncbi:hypothetical protein [Kitasatospora griseola]|uniref:hypothetical protein n=1 Tax=Kitasatospora griseola TaxID=2064 RepID=UPI000A603F9A|nr:hypothetical protein [Kitasatospora griseola]
MKRDYYRENPDSPGRRDRFHMGTRRLSNGWTRVTMWESRGTNTGGPLKKTTADFESGIEAMRLVFEIGDELREEGWAL